jgi:hypothetical protein
MHTFKDIPRNPSRKDLWQFALVLAVGFGLMGLASWWFWSKPLIAYKLWFVACLAAGLALLPGLGRLFYIAWMALGLLLGMLMAPIILGVVFFMLMVPLAFWMRKMRAKKPVSSETYWEDHPQTPHVKHYYKQY